MPEKIAIFFLRFDGLIAAPDVTGFSATYNAPEGERFQDVAVTVAGKTKWPLEPLPPGAVLSALAAAKGHPHQIFVPVNHRVTVTGFCALTSAIERSRKFRRLSDASPHFGSPAQRVDIRDMAFALNLLPQRPIASLLPGISALTSAIKHSRRLRCLVIHRITSARPRHVDIRDRAFVSKPASW